jgi:predicted MPP superfamily phosphohydrolase
MLTFFATVNVIWTLIHAYLARRLIHPLKRRWQRLFLYPLLVWMALVGSGVFAADRLFSPGWALTYRWVAWTYIGSISTLFSLLVARDLLWLALRGIDTLRTRRGQTPILPASPERRRFLLNASGGAAVGATATFGVFGIREARKLPEVVEVDVPIKGLPKAFDGYHIVQLSDVHVGETIDKDFILPIVETVTSLKPDLLALTGDLVDGSVDALRADISPFGYLRARDGVFCVTGNHEYYSGAEAWCAHFRELGLSVLINQHVVIERQGKRLLVAGVTDRREGKNVPGHASDPAGALHGAPAHDTRILLAHQPRSAFEASQHGYALQLSGHTHGGQFFPWNLMVGLVQPVSQGLAQINGMWIYVNRGTCYWGPPLRNFVRPEITSLKLRSA